MLNLAISALLTPTSFRLYLTPTLYSRGDHVESILLLLSQGSSLILSPRMNIAVSAINIFCVCRRKGGCYVLVINITFSSIFGDKRTCFEINQMVPSWEIFGLGITSSHRQSECINLINELLYAIWSSSDTSIMSPVLVYNFP